MGKVQEQSLSIDRRQGHGEIERMKRKAFKSSGQKSINQSSDASNPIICMSIVRFPKGFCQKLSNRVARFLVGFKQKG
ncbi:hypothetical protein AHAS_Ahas19G0078500 [Arachis hypogaea]